MVADAFEPLVEFAGFPSSINKQTSVLAGTLLATCCDFSVLKVSQPGASSFDGICMELRRSAGHPLVPHGSQVFGFQFYVECCSNLVAFRRVAEWLSHCQLVQNDSS